MKKQICFLISFGHKQDGDPGAVSGKFVEAKIAEKITKYIWKELLSMKNRKFLVSFPEKDGVGDHLYEHNAQSVKLSKKYRCVSLDIHLNKFNKNASGSEVWCQNAVGKKKYSTYLGNRILYHLCKLGFVNRGIKYSSDLQFLKNSGIACLVEVAFLDNKKDQKLIDTDAELKKIAHKIVLGMNDYVKKYK